MAIKGIDTSKHQASKVDYVAAKAAGYDFVILRIGSSNTKDVTFDIDYARAVNAGMRIGVYYSVNSKAPAIDEATAIKFANNCLTWLAGKKINMPIVFDIEGNPYNVASRKAANASIYNAFANTVKAKGYKCMLYTGQSLYNYAFDKDAITDPLWIAKYSKSAPNVGRQVAIWQYTSDAIPGDFYKDKLDRNYLNISYDELMSTPATKPPAASSVTNKIKGIDYAKNFITGNIKTITEANVKAMVLQTGLNKDYNAKLIVDGSIGPKTKAALGTHYVKKGEKQWMVTVAEILLYLNGKDPNGVEMPGIYGNGLVKAAGTDKITADMFLRLVK